MKRLLWIPCLLFISASLLMGQPIRKSNYDFMIKTAEDLVEKQDYYNALVWYEQAYEERKDKALALTIADLHYQLRDYRKAERAYARLVNRDKEQQYGEYRFVLGRLLKMNGKYTDAIVELKQFASETTNDSLRQLAQIEIAGAEYARELPETFKGVVVENAGRDVNSKLSEYSPTFKSDNDLIFASLNADEVVVVENDTKAEEAFVRILMSSKNDDKWSKPEPLSAKVNRPGVHTANPSISPDRQRLYYTRSTLQGNNLAVSKIYMSEAGGEDGWKSGNELESVNGDYIAKDPNVGELFGKEVLFFVSNMRGGYGGYDIYYAPYNGDGTYGDPVNLGDKVNSIGDDEKPFYRDGTLYFSSNGHPGLGGHDIFYSTWDGASWSEPGNMGRGYNTMVDDLSFVLNSDGYSGMLTSNREGGRSAHGKTCCDDIYTFEIERMYADLVVGVFSEGDDGKRDPLLGSTVGLVATPFDEPKPAGRFTKDKTNRFDFDLELDYPYTVIATHPDYYPDTFQFNTVGLTESKTFEHRFYLKAKPVPPPVPEFDTIVENVPYVLENILYDFDDDRIRDEAEPDLEALLKIMNDNPDMVIELRSHTDFRGKAHYNQQLSQRRAESARRWLMRRGIERARIQANGYGKTVPQTVTVAANKRYPFLPVGTTLTEAYIKSLSSKEQQEAAHEINRRTEFQIIKGATGTTIKRVRKRTTEKSDGGKDRKSLWKATTQERPKVSELSSLHGRESFEGVPIMTFKERYVDFGMVKKGDKREHEYTFTNKGDTPLEILIISACDCTTTNQDDLLNKTFAPGETGSIMVTFDSKDKEAEEVIDIDIILNNVTPDMGDPIIERIQYHFDIEQ